LLSAVPTLSWGETLVRLAIAAGLAAVIGFERELRERLAGLRTHVLVSIGAALFTLVSAYGFDDFLHTGVPTVGYDPTRIAAQVVTGVGFLGAGAIIRHGTSVRGLTTAATLWVSAAIGIAAGAGYYSGAVLATAVTIFALWPLRYVGAGMVDRLRPESRLLVVHLRRNEPSAPLLDWFKEQGARVDHVRVDERHDRRMVTVTLSAPSEQLLAKVADLDFVQGVEWGR